MKKILVVGDIIVDTYVGGLVVRLNPESIAPLLTVTDPPTHRAGGAANVVANVVGLGLDATLVGVVGRGQAGVPPLGEYVLHHPTRRAPVKTRYVADGRQILRVDDEETSDHDAQTQLAIIHAIISLIPTHDVVVISDYCKGLITRDVASATIDCARERGVPVVVDSKSTDMMRFDGATMWTPNGMEWARFCDGEDRRPNALTMFEHLVITRGNGGIETWSRREPPFRVSAHSVPVYDVAGAGDSVVAALAVFMANWPGWREARSSFENMIGFANAAGAVAVSKPGVSPVSLREVNGLL